MATELKMTINEADRYSIMKQIESQKISVKEGSEQINQRASRRRSLFDSRRKWISRDLSKKHNKKFGKEPASNEDAHRGLLKSHKLNAILLEKCERVISKDLSFSFNNTLYQIDSSCVNRLAGKRVALHVKKGEITYAGAYGKPLKIKEWHEKANKGPQVVDTKELEGFGIQNQENQGRTIHGDKWRALPPRGEQSSLFPAQEAKEETT